MQRITNIKKDIKTSICKDVYDYLSKHKPYQFNLIGEPWNRYDKIQGCLRSILKEEIIIEIDTLRPLAILQMLIVIQRLQKAGYSFVLYDHNGRCPHLHIYGLKELNIYDDELVSEYKKQFIKKYADFPNVDYSLTTIKHSIATEFKTHYKHNKLKDVCYINVDGSIFNNLVESDLLCIANKKVAETHSYVDISDSIDIDWLIDWILTQNEYKHNMNNYLFKNVAISVVNSDFDSDKFLDVIHEVYGTRGYGQFTGWLRWAKGRHVNLNEIITWFEENEINWRQIIRNYNSKSSDGRLNEFRRLRKY